MLPRTARTLSSSAVVRASDRYWEGYGAGKRAGKREAYETMRKELMVPLSGIRKAVLSGLSLKIRKVEYYEDWDRWGFSTLWTGKRVPYRTFIGSEYVLEQKNKASYQLYAGMHLLEILKALEYDDHDWHQFGIIVRVEEDVVDKRKDQ